MPTFNEMLKSKCKNMVADKQRRESLLRLLERRGQEITEATGLKVKISHDKEGNTIWVNIKGSWLSGEMSATQFAADIRVEKEGDRFVYHYRQERYENENTAFDALANDIAAQMPSAEMKKVLEGSH